MPKPRVLVTRRLASEGLDLIAREADMEVWEDELPPPRHVLIEKVKDIDGLLSMLNDKVDAGLMDAAPKLKVVSNFAVGYDNIDIPEATRRGILVGNTPDVLTEATADLAFALLLAAARRVSEADRHTREGKWKSWGPMLLLGRDVYGATLGIVGCGRIGLAMARRARGFNMQVLYYSRSRRSPGEEKELSLEFVPDLHDLLKRSDCVSIHLPLTPQTRHLFGTAEFSVMKPTAVLVNTARGPVVDQPALYEALKSGQIFAAGLDVTEVEPIPLDDPLLTLDNVVITPHIGSGSVSTRTKMSVMAAENLIAGLRGETPAHCVNPEAVRYPGPKT